jgi:hypothetical protein
MSNEEIDKDMKELLKQSIAPVKDTELRRDLWAQTLAKLEEQPAAVLAIPWFDWALAALAGAALIFFPGIIPALFYHL